MLEVERIRKHEWRFVHYWEDSEIKQWLIQNAGKDKRSKTDKVLEL